MTTKRFKAIQFRCAALLLTCATVLGSLALLPASAAADGPVTPTATDYFARVTEAPTGIEAKVVSEYLNLWISVPAGAHVIVRDYIGAPWVRFTPSGVSVNRNSEEYYESQVPVPAVTPARLTHRPFPAPDWVNVSSGHAYAWREGRLHALANVALIPGQSRVGVWRIPVDVNGRPGVIKGVLLHRGAPSFLWFWPVLVLLVCALAAWRLRSPELDRRLSLWLGLVLLALALVGMGSKYMHGSPNVTAGNIVLLLLTVAIFGAVARRLLSGRFGGPLLLATVVIALWAGLTLLPVLTHGYALVVIPIFLARVIAASLLGGALSLTLFALRMLDHSPA